ncbi:MAG: hypothetical protein HXX16_20605 [Bacteroidales bacterium]|nr:hypothetical protein [Bacteroidales bacterium]
MNKNLINNEVYYDASQSQKSTFLRCLCSKEKSNNFNVSFSISIEAVDYNALRKSFDILIQRHEIFRTTLLMIDGVIKQKIWSPHEYSEFKINIIDLKTSSNKKEALLKLEKDSNQTAFKAEQHPWLDVKLVQLEKNEHKLLISIPHMISDYESLPIIINELQLIYKSLLAGEIIRPSNTFQYKDYIAEINNILESKVGEKHYMYWQNILKEIPSSNLTSIYSIAKNNKYKSYKATILQEIDEYFGELPPQIVSAFMGTLSYIIPSQGTTYYLSIDSRRLNILKGVAKESNVLLSVLITSTFHLLIYKLTGEKDTIIGINQNLRDRGDLYKIIGFFINTILFRDKKDDSLTLCEYFRNANRNYVEALQHKIYPFEKALYDSDISLNSLGTFFLNIVNDENVEGNEDGLESNHREEIVFPYFNIDCHIVINSNMVGIRCCYKTEIFAKNTIEHIFSNYFELIDNFEMSTVKKIEDISLAKK